MGQLVYDHIDEGAIAGQKSCVHLVSACAARRRANVLGVKNERQAFSCDYELNKSSNDASAGSTHHPAVRERRRQNQEVIHSKPVRADDILLFGQESGYVVRRPKGSRVDEAHLPVSSLNSQNEASMSSGSAQTPLFHDLPSTGANAL